MRQILLLPNDVVNVDERCLTDTKLPTELADGGGGLLVDEL